MTECDEDPRKCTTTSTVMSVTSDQSTKAGNSEMLIIVYH